MPLDLTAVRRGPLDRLTGGDSLALTVLPPASRFILRGRPGALEAAEAAFGITLPQQACRAASSGDHAALWLGPDEWLLLAPTIEQPGLLPALAAALHEQSHSLVDVSHRQTGLQISGLNASTTLNAGCPLDLDAEMFPVGMCTRTVLAKTEIVLWRTAPMTFRIEVWRSFTAYAWRFLAEAARELRP